MLPDCYVLMLAEFIGDNNAKKVSEVWYRFSQLHLSSASREDILREAKLILTQIS